MWSTLGVDPEGPPSPSAALHLRQGLQAALPSPAPLPDAASLDPSTPGARSQPDHFMGLELTPLLRALRPAGLDAEAPDGGMDTPTTVVSVATASTDALMAQSRSPEPPFGGVAGLGRHRDSVITVDGVRRPPLPLQGPHRRVGGDALGGRGGR